MPKDKKLQLMCTYQPGVRSSYMHHLWTVEGAKLPFTANWIVRAKPEVIVPPSTYARGKYWASTLHALIYLYSWRQRMGYTTPSTVFDESYPLHEIAHRLSAVMSEVSDKQVVDQLVELERAPGFTQQIPYW